MAVDYIAVTRTNRPQLGNQVISAANRLKELAELIDGLSAIAGHQWDVGDYTTLEAQFGLSAGQGANFLTLLTYMQEIFNTNTDVTGANRLARLREFVGRLAGQ